MNGDKMNFLLGIVAVLVAFLGAFLQTRKLMGLGSDHVVHLFLIDRIRENRHRLFVEIPKLLNQSFCSAYPLFMHWLLSFLSKEKIHSVATIMNGTVNGLQTIGVYLIVRYLTDFSDRAGAVALIFALTPQFYHVFSARNYGLTARPLGVLMLTSYFSSLFIGEHLQMPLIKWVGGGVFAYLVWGFNVLAMQGMLLIGVFLLLVFQYPEALVVAMIGGILLILINRPYGWSYISNTLKFINAYRTDLAPVFILKKRESIWRDFVFDFWNKKGYGHHELNYIYTNGAVIAHVLNPFGLICLISLFYPQSYSSEIVRYSSVIGACGYLTFFITSFRMTRFLGEPERYIEMVTLFSTIGGSAWLTGFFGVKALWIVFFYFVLCNATQAVIIFMTCRKYGDGPKKIQKVVDAVQQKQKPDNIRFASNNEELTKLFMGQDWRFARFNSAEQDYAGFKGIKAFVEFPLVRQEAFESLLKKHRINLCLLDREHFENIVFSDGGGPKSIEIVYKDERMKALKLSWE
ncbi:hypothetical protein N8737_02170 [Verrucomicrobia bacterium]|nr:hypothetical protein [Verrucomicrobiota bacterium]MDA7657486.1 hypothetical protein [Verrucomicrobiota bacterium]